MVLIENFLHIIGLCIDSKVEDIICLYNMKNLASTFDVIRNYLVIINNMVDKSAENVEHDNVKVGESGPFS